jgi:hypothetical protein
VRLSLVQGLNEFGSRRCVSSADRAAILVVAGIVTLLGEKVIVGIVLIVVGLAVGPGGWSILQPPLVNNGSTMELNAVGLVWLSGSRRAQRHRGATEKLGQDLAQDSTNKRTYSGSNNGAPR